MARLQVVLLTASSFVVAVGSSYPLRGWSLVVAFRSKQPAHLVLCTRRWFRLVQSEDTAEDTAADALPDYRTEGVETESQEEFDHHYLRRHRESIRDAAVLEDAPCLVEVASLRSEEVQARGPLVEAVVDIRRCHFHPQSRGRRQNCHHVHSDRPSQETAAGPKNLILPLRAP